VLAAIFLDGGLCEAAAFVRRALASELEEATPESAAAADYKTMLQERLQAERPLAPHYDVVETLGRPHARTFLVEVSWDDEQARGEGQTIKSAETDAARRALEGMDAPPDGEGEKAEGSEQKAEDETQEATHES